MEMFESLQADEYWYRRHTYQFSIRYLEYFRFYEALNMSIEQKMFEMIRPFF